MCLLRCSGEQKCWIWAVRLPGSRFPPLLPEKVNVVQLAKAAVPNRLPLSDFMRIQAVRM